MLKLVSPGVYLFGAGKKVQVSTADFLVVLFHSPSSQSSGFVLEQSDEHRSDFLSELTELYHKYSELPDVDPALIKVKVMGAQAPFGPLMVSLRSWLSRHQIPVITNDFGRSLKGMALIDCSSGKIGIQFSPGRVNPATLLSSGTARNRNPRFIPSFNILILSKNPNNRILAKQAIEEEMSWQAHCPIDFSINALEGVFNTLKFSALILTDDFIGDEEVSRWALESSKRNPKLILGFVGSKLPVWGTPQMRLLPPLEPYLISRFKKILKKSFADLLFSETSDTFTFPKKRKA